MSQHFQLGTLQVVEIMKRNVYLHHVKPATIRPSGPLIEWYHGLSRSSLFAEVAPWLIKPGVSSQIGVLPVFTEALAYAKIHIRGAVYICSAHTSTPSKFAQVYYNSYLAHVHK